MSEYFIDVNNKKLSLNLKKDDIIEIDGKEFPYEILQKSDYTYVLRFNHKLYTITKVTNENNPFGILVEGNYFQVSVRTKLEVLAAELAEKGQSSSQGKKVKSPMPGLVLKIKKQVGDKVSAGESVMILEAMKMENDIKSPKDGIISQILVTEKQAVEKSAHLFSLD